MNEQPLCRLLFAFFLCISLFLAACDLLSNGTPTNTPSASVPTQTSTVQVNPTEMTRTARVPTSSPQSSPTPAPTTPVPPAIRDLGKDVDAALQRRDIDFFKQRAVTQPVTCRAEHVPPGLGGPDCKFVGQQFDGFLVAHWLFEGAIVPVEDALAQIERLWAESLPQERDQFGDGSPKVYALGPSAVILTALIQRPQNFAGSGPLRVSLVTHWEQDGNSWRFVRLLVAFVLAEDFLVHLKEMLYKSFGAGRNFRDLVVSEDTSI